MYNFIQAFYKIINLAQRTDATTLRLCLRPLISQHYNSISEDLRVYAKGSDIPRTIVSR